MTFKIPKNYDITLLTEKQKDELCIAITQNINEYMSSNRLQSKYKDQFMLDKYLDIRYNLINSESLLDKVNTDIITISSLPWLEPYKLDDKLWKALIEKRNRNKETKEKMATVNIFKCRKCGEMKCTTYQLQTASIDEPMTTYIRCTVCGNQWKV